jgi:gliding motility-associated-like protein
MQMLKTKLLSTILLLLSIHFVKAQSASFMAPDTACINSPITFTNTSNPNHNFEWNFCLPKFDTIVPEAQLVGNLYWPASSTYVEANGKHYGFVMYVVPFGTGGIMRMDFGNSLGNTPTYTNLGSFGGLADMVMFNEIQVVEDNGEFHLFICGFRQEIYSSRHTIARIDLGNSIESTTGVATDISPTGNLEAPASMTFAKTNEGWFALVANRPSPGSIILLQFGWDIKSVPTVTNYRNFNNTFYNPNSIALINERDNWYALLISSASGGVFKLNFGNSLLNAPAISQINTPELDRIHASKLTIARDCDYTYCFIPALVEEKMIRLNFSSLSLQPTSNLIDIVKFTRNNFSLSNIIFDGTHSWFFVSKTDIFLGSAYDTLFRFRFNTCTGSDMPGFVGFQPPPVTFNAPGRYNISLIQDKNLPTESVFCKDIVIEQGGNRTTTAVSFCRDDSIQLRPSFRSGTYLWNNASTDSLFTVFSPGKYWVMGDDLFCGVDTDSFSVSVQEIPNITITKSNDIDCSFRNTTLTANGALNYRWLPSSSFENETGNPQILRLDSTSSITVIGTNEHQCSSTASVTVMVDFTQSKNLYLVPNAFTPNNNGKNDCFGVAHWGEVDNFNFKIFNRWGQTVFETNDSRQCWNGKYKTGQPAETGTYAYLITGTNLCEGNLKKSGTFQLIR